MQRSKGNGVGRNVKCFDFYFCVPRKRERDKDDTKEKKSLLSPVAHFEVKK